MVVDLKTGKYPPADETLASNPQLGLYQLAVDHGAVDDLVAGRRACRAAPSSASCARRPAAQLKVQPQAPQEPDDDGSRPVERQLMQAAVGRCALEVFPARPERAHCDRCEFAALCPAQVSGSVLS